MLDAIQCHIKDSSFLRGGLTTRHVITVDHSKSCQLERQNLKIAKHLSLYQFLKNLKSANIHWINLILINSSEWLSIKDNKNIVVNLYDAFLIWINILKNNFRLISRYDSKLGCRGLKVYHHGFWVFFFSKLDYVPGIK